MKKAYSYGGIFRDFAVREGGLGSYELHLISWRFQLFMAKSFAT